MGRQLKYDQAKLAVLSLIASEKLQPGDKIMTEQQLLSHVPCSRITLRKALESLEHDGMIERHVGRGTFLKQCVANKNKSGKILLAVDKFKGSLTSLEAESAIEEGILDSAGMDGGPFGCVPDIVKLPMADGGDGSLEAVSAVWGPSCRRIRCRITGPLGEPAETEFLISGERAFIEMAKVCGLVMVPESERNPLNTTTYGLGETMLEAYGAGARQIFVSIGGSATNDCGAGMMQALGYEFLDSEGEVLGIPVSGRDLVRIKRVLPDGNILAGCNITAICDVTNPLLGDNGATMVYGRQKGADDAGLALLEAGMENFSAAALCSLRGREADPDFPGAGAAGGVGFALKYFAGATLFL